MGDYIPLPQKFKDAEIDADSLENIINGPANQQTTTRLGRGVWNIATINSRIERTIQESDAAVSQIQSKKNQTTQQADAAIVQVNQAKDSAQGALDSAVQDFNEQGDVVLSEFRDAVQTIVVDDGVPAQAVVVGDSTLDVFAETMSRETYRITNLDNLFYTDDFLTPPYSAEVYEKAYQNGIKISDIIKREGELNKSRIVFEFQKKIPLIFKSLSATTDFNPMVANGAIDFSFVYNLEIDFNGCSPYILFDSQNKHQYNNTPESFAAYKLSGSLLSFSNVRNITFSNGLIRGDMYNRLWVEGENQTEQTHGFRAKTNCRNVYFKNMKFTGFRGDGVSGSPRGTILQRLTDWQSGGLDAENGGEIVLAGAYRSERVDLSGFSIIDNMLQISATGYLYQIPWRNPSVQVFFFDESQVFIEMQVSRQSQDISIPKNAKYVQLVALDDERTDATVRYDYTNIGTTGQVIISTGMSAGFYFDKDCEFYENHRGGISNLGNETFIDHSLFRDSGRLSKMGFPFFGNPTQYAVNFEDIFLSKLEVVGATAKNTPQGFLGNCGNFIVDRCTLQGQYYYAINDYSSTSARVTNNLIENARLGAFSFIKHQMETKSMLTIDNNQVKNCRITLDCSSYPSQTIKFTNNIAEKSSCIAQGDGNNFELSNNYIELNRTETSTISRITGVTGGANTFIYSKNLPRVIDSTINQEGVKNTVLVYATDQSIVRPTQNSTVLTKNCKFTSNGKTLRLGLNNSVSGWVDHKDKHHVVSCDFSNVALTPVFNLTGQTSYPLEMLLNDVKFENNAHLRFEKRDSIGTVNTITISNSTFDVTNSDYVIMNIYTLLGSLEIKFINCIFVSNTEKTIKLVRAGGGATTANITSKLIGCKLVNVTNDDGITTDDSVVVETPTSP